MLEIVKVAEGQASLLVVPPFFWKSQQTRENSEEGGLPETRLRTCQKQILTSQLEILALTEPVKNDGFLRLLIRCRDNQHAHSRFKSLSVGSEYTGQPDLILNRTNNGIIDTLHLFQNLLDKLLAHSILLFLGSQPTVKLPMQQKKGVMAKNKHELALVKTHR